MEIIKNYLDTMFANLPNTEVVLKAKAELLSMMEDKYNELIEEGNTENTAVGTVISEFGNLDELAEDLGISEEIDSEFIEEMSNRIFISKEKAKEYVDYEAKSGLLVALAILLCITCVVGPIFSKMFLLSDAIGVTVMFSMIAVAVGMFIYNGNSDNKWKFIKKQPCRIDIQTAQYLVEERDRYEKAHAIRTAFGVVLCSMCWFPAAILDGFLPGRLGEIGGGLLFIFLGLGVFLLVYSSSIMKSYNTLIALNDSSAVGGNFDKHEVEWINDKVRLVMELYWPVITAVYLCWSFLTFQWWRTWIIWPIAGIIFGVLKANLRKR